MKAGQLEIEIMANVASLQSDMRKLEQAVGRSTSQMARDAKVANDNLRGIGRGAGQGMQEFTRDVTRLKAQLDPAWAGLQRYKQQVELLRTALAQGAITHKQYVDQMRQAVNAYKGGANGVVQATNAQRAGMQQLSFQLGDVATMFSMGASPMRIFASQASQVTQAVGLMTNGQKGLIAFMGGPWGQVLIGAVTILGTLIAAHQGAAGAAEEQTDAAKELKDATNDLYEATVRESMSTWASIQTDIDKANSLRQRANEARAAAMAELALAKARAGAARASIVPGAPGYSNAYNLGEQAKQEALMREFDAEIAAQQKLIDQNSETIRLKRGAQTRMEVAAEFDGAAAATLKYERALDGLNRELKAGSLSQSEYRAQLTAITQTRESETEAARKSERTSRQRRAALTDEQRAAQQQTKETARFIETLELEIAKIGLDEKALRQLEVARARSEAQTDAEREAIDRLNTQREEALALEKAEQAAKANDDFRRKEIAAAERSLQLIGLTGVAREKMSIAIAEQAEIEAVLVEIQKAEAEGNTALIAQLQERIRLIQQKYDVERQGVDMAQKFENEAESARLLNDELRNMVGLLGNLGSVGEAVGALLGLASGNVGAIGGPIGDILNMQTGTMKDADGRVIARTLGDELREVFKLNGEFGKTMSSILQGAGSGLMAGNAFFGKQSTAEQMGSAVGGAVAGAFSKDISKLLGGGALGAIGGALAPILGGVLGSLAGSLFNKAKSGGARITGVDSVSAFGNSGSRRSAAGTLAGEVIAGLEQIADLFGATIGSFNTSIGIYKDKFRVRTDGGTQLGGYKGSESENERNHNLYNFGEDAAAAVAFAIADAVKDGALQGLRAGTERLIKASGDIEKQLAKAMEFEGIFDEFKQRTDPVGHAMEALAKEAERLEAIFEEAGATAEEYAQLEQVLQMRREEAMERAEQAEYDKMRDQRELEIRILELLGKEEEALAKARELELGGMKATLRPLQQMIYQLEDARLIMEQFEPLAADLRLFKAEILGGLGNSNSFSFLAAQFREIAALAKDGDIEALGKLRGTASDFLEAAKANATSDLDYRRAVSQVLGAVDDGIFAADSQVEYAQLQIEAIERVGYATEDLKKTIEPYLKEAVEQGRKVENLLSRFEGDGFPIKTFLDEPIAVDLVE